MPKLVENFWYPILDARTLKGSDGPIPVRRFGVDLVLWRGERGELVCMEDRCPHKRVALSRGSVVGETLQCAYHGMRFDSGGRCVHVPAYGSTRAAPKNLLVKRFAVREAHGLVWLWWGTETPESELPFYAQLAGEDFDVPAVSVHYPLPFYRVMESSFDAYHVEHLHRKTAPRIGSLIHDFRCEVNGRRIDTVTEFRKTPEGPSLVTHNSVLFPALALAYTPQLGTKNLVAVSPVDDDTSWFIIRFFHRPLRLPIVGKVLRRVANFHFERFVLPEDYGIQRTQEPRDCGMGADRLVVSVDAGIGEYWRLLRKGLGLAGSAASVDDAATAE